MSRPKRDCVSTVCHISHLNCVCEQEYVCVIKVCHIQHTNAVDEQAKGWLYFKSLSYLTHVDGVCVQAKIFRHMWMLCV